MESLILAIDTSCDETSAAVTCGQKVLSNVISSQVYLHKKYGGVYPALAKRAHEERIDAVVEEALRRARIGWEVRSRSRSENEKWVTAVAVTQGPGLAIALEVGIRKAKEIVNNVTMKQFNNRPPLIAINHLEGHIYSCLAENAKGLPKREIAFPGLCLIVSGGHTELVLMKDHGKYEVLGATLDDACGEALDKAAKILHLGYPGGPIVEKLAESFYKASPCHARGRLNESKLSKPLKDKSNLNFSYSGLKTQFLYLVEKMTEEELGKNLHQLAYTFQEACFEQLLRKTAKAIEMYQPKMLLCGGGVIANKHLRSLLRKLAKNHSLPILFPPKRNLITDNAAMIGIAAYYKYQRKEFVNNPEDLDREPRLSL